MKLKEYPSSLYNTFKLRLVTAGKLGAGASVSEEPIIVSFTSIQSRLPVVATTVRSLLRQSVQPEKIVLWLHTGLKGKVPDSLQKLVGVRFTIEYRDRDSSHCKLVHALTEYPQHFIVTCDDDLIYPEDWLARLISFHRKYPDSIVAHECRNIAYDSNQQPEPYLQWHRTASGDAQVNTMALGYGGVLYPPGSLHSDVTSESLYMKLTPKADDLWFKAMAMLQGTEVRRTDCDKPKPLPVAGSQKVALGKVNIKQDKNREQWVDVVRHYQL
jgi:hypothetical protein